MALSVDGSFVKESVRAITGMVLRVSDGVITFSAYRYLFHCNDALESKVSAVLEGLSMSMQQ